MKANKLKNGINLMMNKMNVKAGHIVTTVALAAVAFTTTFTITGANTSEVQAQVNADVQKVDVYNKEAINVDYGNNEALLNVAKEILSKGVSKVEEAKKMVLADGSEAYQLGDYLVKIGAIQQDGKNTICPISIEKRETAKKMLMGNDDKTKINRGTAYVYNVKVNLVDETAPTFDLTKKHVKIKADEKFNAKKYVKNVMDNHDDKLKVDIDKDGLSKNKKGHYKAGTYTIIYTVEDKAGNKTKQKLTLDVEKKKAKKKKEDKKEVEENKVEIDNNVESGEATSSNTSTKTYNKSTKSGSKKVAVKAGASKNGNAIAQAALAQVGVHQDCTMLVTNSLKAVGINFHGWPKDYLSLGKIVSNPKPGDICVYGNAHVAIYIGGGKAVHGGWEGNTTKVASVKCSAGTPVYVRV